MLTDEEFEKLEARYLEERSKRWEVQELQRKIDDLTNSVEQFEINSSWTSLCNIKLSWDESTSDVEGRREISREHHELEFHDSTLFVSAMKEKIKELEDELKKIKGENRNGKTK